MSETADCVVVGSGVVGLSIARALSRGGRNVLVLDSQDAIGTGISSRNSEVIHSGLYYTHNSLKARLCAAGRDMLYDFCKDMGVATIKTGKIIVAKNETEIQQLRELEQHAAGNGIPLLYLTSSEAKTMEPNLVCAGGLYSPSTGIVDSHNLMLALQGDAEAHGATVVLNSPVVGGEIREERILLNIGGIDPISVECNTVINAAGLGAHLLSQTIKGIPENLIPQVYFAKGSYFYLMGPPPFSRLVYPLPSAASLGIHYTLDLSTQGRFGPDIQWVDDINYDIDEKKIDIFYEEVRQYFPDLDKKRLMPGYTGIRPKLQAPSKPIADFVIQLPKETGISGYIALYGIESPGLTSCLAIADYVTEGIA